MSKYQDLKNDIAALFGASQDQEIIKQSAVIASKIDDLENENTALIKSKASLLEDYKKVVITAAYKPANGEKITGGDTPKPKSFEEALKDFKKGK